MAALSASVITGTAVSDDGSRVVLRTTEHVYSVPVTGGTPVQLSVPQERNHSSLDDVLITPDGERVIYMGDHDDTNDELYSVLAY